MLNATLGSIPPEATGHNAKNVPVDEFRKGCVSPMITAGQCRAARAFLEWSQADLAKATAVSQTTIRNFEAGRTTPIALTLKAICEAMEAQGVEFTNGDVPGVRLRPRS